MITAEQEANLAAANSRSKKKQDKTNPFVVNVKNGRLMPNTPRLRVHKDYRVYPASLEEAQKSTTADRMKWIERSAAMRTDAPRIVNSKAAEDAFDVGTATADDLAVFAMETWGLALDPKKPLKTLRSEVMKKAAEMEALENAAAAGGSDLS
jgi:hypothetical protein